MRTNSYPKAVLQRRSELATKVRFGAEARIAAHLGQTLVTDVPFPKGLAPVPKPLAKTPKPSDSLPKADVIAMVDTAAEAHAMAEILTPGHAYTTWYPYAKNFEKTFLPQIGPRGPSRESKRLGSYFPVTINGLDVLIYKSELHMHEDAKKMPDGSYSMPIKEMFSQMIGDARPGVFLTTGTSGGFYCSMSLGDVVVSRAARFQCQQDFKDASFNNQTYTSHWNVPTKYIAAAQKIMQGYASHLTGKTDPKGTPPNAKCGCSPLTYPTKIWRDGFDDIPEFHPILTTDFFEYGTSMNNLDKVGMAVEMDDACLGLACSDMHSPPHWACVRNLSDPTINGELAVKLQEDCAEYYYVKFGFWTTVMSALTTWSIVAGLGDKA